MQNIEECMEMIHIIRLQDLLKRFLMSIQTLFAQDSPIKQVIMEHQTVSTQLMKIPMSFL